MRLIDYLLRRKQAGVGVRKDILRIIRGQTLRRYLTGFIVVVSKVVKTRKKVIYESYMKNKCKIEHEGDPTGAFEVNTSE